MEAEPRRKRRGPLVAAAAVFLVGLVAGLVAIAGGGDRNQAAPGHSPSAAGGSAPSTDNGVIPPVADTPSPHTPDPVPAGWRLYRDPAGFSVGVPETWDRSVAGTTVTFRDPGSTRFVRIQPVPNTGVDPYDYWLARQAAAASRTMGYDFIRIARVMYRGWPTADWEYRSGNAGARAHVLTRIIAPDGPRAYTIYWSTSDSRWTADHKFFDTVVGTFGIGQ
jgi:hypothetical protein